jgi:hypothetical protein
MTRKHHLQEIEGWLRTTLTVAEVEGHFALADREWQRSLGYPSGWLARFNREVRAIMEPGDELWRYNSGPEERISLHGQRGIALVRKGRVIHFIRESRK